MHYGTFPILTGTPEAFGRELKERQAEAELRVMKVGETVSLGEAQKKLEAPQDVTRFIRRN
jgi:L-ascorbate metabolism protein UlaG (beta-lactamase superfamily)